MRIDTMYIDRLDGRITASFYDEKSKEWRDQQKQIDGRMAQLATGGVRSAREALQIMRSVSDACAGFGEAEPKHQRAIANALLENPTWKGGKFESAWQSPFDILALSNSASQRNERDKSGSGLKTEIWLLR
jgi:hypothetical protein